MDLAVVPREEHPDRGAFAERARRLDPSAMGLEQMLDDRQPQPRAPLLARAPGIGPVEALEDAGQVLRADPRARVCHGDAPAPRRPVPGPLAAAPRRPGAAGGVTQ